MNTAADQDRFLRKLANVLDEVLAQEFEHRIGFALFVFEFESDKDDKAALDKAANYISNGRREDMIKFLRESADRLENNEDIGVSIGEA